MFEYIYPHVFFKKASGILQSPPSIRSSVRLSRYLLLNHWTKTNQIWCVSCSHVWGVQRHIFSGSAPWGSWEGPKGQIHVRSLNIIKFQLLSHFQRFVKPNFVCLLKNERYKIYQTGFSFGPLGHTPGVGLGGTVGGCGVKKIFFSKFNQILCVSYLHEWHMQRHHFLGPRPFGPWGGAKRSNIIRSELQSQSQRFLNQTLCIFSQMKDM